MLELLIAVIPTLVHYYVFYASSYLHYHSNNASIALLPPLSAVTPPSLLEYFVHDSIREKQND